MNTGPIVLVKQECSQDSMWFIGHSPSVEWRPGGGCNNSRDTATAGH